jgi:hypothetical protein
MWALPMLCVYSINEFVPLLHSQVLVIPPDLARHAPQAVECCVAGSINSVILPDMDVILRVNLVYNER